MKIGYILTTWLITTFCLHSNATGYYDFTSNSSNDFIGKSILIFEDKTAQLNIMEVLASSKFKSSRSKVPFLGITNSNWWLKFEVGNSSDKNLIYLTLDQPTIDFIDFYELKQDGTYNQIELGEYKPFTDRVFKHQKYIFKLNIKPGNKKQYLIRLKSGEQILVPLKISSGDAMTQSLLTNDLFYGIYIGVILIMLVYNLFIYLSVRDPAYIWYVIYILLVGLTQTSLTGYTHRFLWPNNPWIAEQSVFLFPSLVGVAGIWFMKVFLHTKEHVPKLDKVIYVFIALSLVNIVLAIMGLHNLSQQMIQINAMLISFYMIFVSAVISRKGYRAARFFLYAWIIFLIGVFIFVLKDIGVLPYNQLTIFMMPIGSGIEVALLSLALADRINILKKEKEESQEQVLLTTIENVRIIKEQNSVLEHRVKHRTLELEKSNEELSVTYYDLKHTQSKLVESEKMASLGQLTAGIAHEINNPINFVTANVEPLRRDIKDIISLVSKYGNLDHDKDLDAQIEEINKFTEELDLSFLKIEMDELISGIAEGANRTAEIVKGLRNFSRLDEGDLKYANINEGIKSTLKILETRTNELEIDVVLKLSQIDAIECYPGKLNQLFMNLLSNAIQALESNLIGDRQIVIDTKEIDNSIEIKIKDNGVGMSEGTKIKIFEPFFTTKDVGEGTGLGLSIAYSIVEVHKGSIVVESKVGVGTEFIIKIPMQFA